MKCDVLIIGSGVAGLSLANKIARVRKDLSIIITTKTNFLDSNSALAQGGVAAVMDLEDSIENHIKDTIEAGDGLCNLSAVHEIVGQGPDRIKELIEWGWKADTRIDKRLDLAKEGGHSTHRVVHQGDQSGKSIIEVLISQAQMQSNITLQSEMLSIDLIRQKDNCIGASFFNIKERSFESIISSVTVLATGGAGQVYQVTTNPKVATGDGLAMAKRIGASISSMEFVQFHPTALYIHGQKGKAFLISEAVRGAGAILRTEDGKSFMEKYDSRGSLAPRDIVARAISREINKRKSNCVYLDCTSIDGELFKKHFPNIYKTCLELNIDPKIEMIPVAPAAHYICGGIDTDLNGRTTVNRLYAIGECANTGLHGANRLASNSLLEALAISHNCANKIAESNLSLIEAEAPDPLPISLSRRPKNVLLNWEAIIQFQMTLRAGIVRSDEELAKAQRDLIELRKEILKYKPSIHNFRQYQRVKNLCCVALMIINQSLARNQNAGGFYKLSIGKTKNPEETPIYSIN